MILDEENYLEHFGILRKSGRYPWGSGGTVEGRSRSFIEYVKDLLGMGVSEATIAEGVGLTVAELRSTKTIARAELKASMIAQCQALRDSGNSPSEIGRRLGMPEPTVRSYLQPGADHKALLMRTISDQLREAVGKDNLIDVGSGVATQMGISNENLRVAVTILKDEGYEIHRVPNPQLVTGKDTHMKILCPPGTTQREAFLHKLEIKQVRDYSVDNGETFLGLLPPLSINPKRLQVNYRETGGDTLDGVIYVRPGVKDVSLDQSTYSQVRCLVGKDRYLKGMAIYKDNLPDGIDLVFNTNKAKADFPNPLDTLKNIEKDTDNPFGTIVRQISHRDKNGKQVLDSAMGIVYEEGKWGEWTKTLSPQVLSKQSPALAKQQLDLAFEERKAEFTLLKSLTNPVVKKHLLEKFAESTDSAAVGLKAAKLPRQAWRVILPLDSLKVTEVYAPGYTDGERVALIRYPHGGTFEIPELTVNNRNREGKKYLGDAKDALGINHKVAERLSGADFDGDTVLVVPNKKGIIKSTPALAGLKGFNPQASYPGFPGMKKLEGKRMQAEMGNISNLITDMTLRQAPIEHIARAVRHSMVVIDAEKHTLNYKLSEERNGIRALKEKYQKEPTGGKSSGASTIISRAGAKIYVDAKDLRRMSEGGPVDLVTGKKIEVPTGKTYVNRAGERVLSKQKVKRLSLHDDAFDLVEGVGTPMERLYANHSNRLKAMANKVRLETVAVETKKFKPPPSAKEAYKVELQSLDSKLALIEQRRPLERQAQLIGTNQYRAKVQANPNMTDDSKKKVRFQAQEAARNRMGLVKGSKVDITPREWEAIQSGAVSNSKLKQILAKADIEQVKQYATPHRQLLMTSPKVQRARGMADLGYTRSEIAAALGVSVSTLDTALDG